MKELNDIDKLIRSSLADYKPVPEKKNKERFLTEATGLWSAGRNRGLNRKILTLLAVLLLSTVGTAYYFLHTESPQTRNNLRATNNNTRIKSVKQKTNTPEAHTVTETPARHTPSTTATKNHGNETGAKKLLRNKPSGETPATTTSRQPEPDETVRVHDVPTPPRSATYREHLFIVKELPARKIFSVSEVSYVQEPRIDMDLTHLSLPVIAPENKKDIPIQSNKNLQLAYSIYYRPELIFNVIDKNKLIHNTGLDVHIKLFNDKYILRTGVGTSLSKGYNEYAVLYNEYLGSYEGLDSITFAWSDNHHQLIPTYYMSERDVYDSVIQTEITSVYKRYTYLQIPLVFGYDFITNDKYSLGVRFGPTFSALLASKTLSDNFDPGKHKVLQINQITPDRIKTNWLLMAGFNFSMYAKKKLFYEIEPRFSYYFNSVYQKYDASNPPFSIGLRLSIGIK